jgi:acetoin utilization deacetylase AcuC-like enzyme
VRAFYCDHFVLPLPPGHRFPMEKYRLLRERVEAFDNLTLSVPEAATDDALSRVHTQDYVSRASSGSLTRDEVRRIGFPWSPALVERSRRSVGGTIAAARVAHMEGAAANLAGGTHHAYADRGEGFCVFNDVAVAIREMQTSHSVKRCAILDLDVHQGNGSAAIFADDPDVFTLSVHGASNYPFRKEESDLDFALQDAAGDDEFLEAVRTGVARALSTSPDLAFYIAGADPFEGDRLGRLHVSKPALGERDSIVIDGCVSAGVPLVVVMAGGYAEEVEDTVDIHAATVRAAMKATQRPTSAGVHAV